MAYVLDGNKKYNIIWGKDFNKWRILINNTLSWNMKDIWLNCQWFESWYISHIFHKRNKNQGKYKLTPYYIITFVHLCNVCHKSNDDTCGTEQTLWEFIYNAVQPELFWCSYKYMNMKSVILIYNCFREIMWQIMY